MICLMPMCAYLSETSRMIQIYKALKAQGAEASIATHGGVHEALLQSEGIPYDIVGPRMTAERGTNSSRTMSALDTPVRACTRRRDADLRERRGRLFSAAQGNGRRDGIYADGAVVDARRRHLADHRARRRIHPTAVRARASAGGIESGATHLQVHAGLVGRRHPEQARHQDEALSGGLQRFGGRTWCPADPELSGSDPWATLSS